MIKDFQLTIKSIEYEICWLTLLARQTTRKSEKKMKTTIIENTWHKQDSNPTWC